MKLEWFSKSFNSQIELLSWDGVPRDQIFNPRLAIEGLLHRMFKFDRHGKTGKDLFNPNNKKAVIRQKKGLQSSQIHESVNEKSSPVGCASFGRKPRSSPER